MIAFSQRSEKACLHATNPVASKDLSLGHFQVINTFLREGNGRVISIHAEMRLLQGKRQIIDVNQEQGWTKTRALRNSTIYSPYIRGGTIYPAELFTVIQV